MPPLCPGAAIAHYFSNSAELPTAPWPGMWMGSHAKAKESNGLGLQKSDKMLRIETARDHRSGMESCP